MNTWTGSGFITKEPDIRVINKKNGEQMKVARFTVACQRDGKDAGADYIPVVVFGKAAEVVEKYFKKGSGCEVRGRIQTGSYDGKNGKVYTTEVYADKVEFPKARKSETAESQPQTESAPQQTAPQSAPDDGFMSIPEGIEAELPFR